MIDPLIITIDPFASQLPEAIQVCSFSLAEPMVRLKRNKFFEGRALKYFCLSWAYGYQEDTIPPNRFL